MTLPYFVMFPRTGVKMSMVEKKSNREVYSSLAWAQGIARNGVAESFKPSERSTDISHLCTNDSIQHNRGIANRIRWLRHAGCNEIDRKRSNVSQEKWLSIYQRALFSAGSMTGLDYQEICYSNAHIPPRYSISIITTFFHLEPCVNEQRGVSKMLGNWSIVPRS